jgi:hypothetical protein
MVIRSLLITGCLPLLAMLASRGRRLRAMSLLRVGKELIRHEQRYRIELTSAQNKTPEPDRFNLPESLTRYMRRYLHEVRPALLQGQMHDALWVNPKGGRWTAKGIQHRVMKLTLQRFGIAFGPHRLRHAIGTTAPMRDPCHPGVAAGVLGISAGARAALQPGRAKPRRNELRPGTQAA